MLSAGFFGRENWYGFGGLRFLIGEGSRDAFWGVS